MNKQPLVDFQNVSLSFRRRIFRKNHLGKPIFRNLNWKLGAGEVVGLCGKNGAGKSTFLRLIAGTLVPDQGLIVNRAEHSALLTLGPAIEPRLPGRMNAILLGLYLGYQKDEIRRRLDEIIDFSGISDVIDDPVYTYSNGMRARLSFSVALHLNSDLLLIDEILSVGDPEFRKKSSQALKEKLAGDSAAIIVSNNTRALESLCDRVYEVRDQKIYAS